jgi:hypothetical protein
MKRPLYRAGPQFSQPVRQIVIMLLILGLSLLGAYIAWPRVSEVFLANIWLNGFIFMVFVIGVMACFLQVFSLISSVNWIEGFAAETPGHHLTHAPRMLAPLAALLRTRDTRRQITASSARSILDSVATRIDEARDITRYIVNLLVFLGLLGTFFGLATTVPAVVETIRSLAPNPDEPGLAVFDRLMAGLEEQLGGMGTAFSSSLLGLAGSLIVGLLELFAGHGQNRFFRELEEWLSTITRLGFAGGDADGEGAGDGGGAMVAVVDAIGEQVEAIQVMLSQAEIGRRAMDTRLAELGNALDRLGERIETDTGATAALDRLAAGQERMIAALESGAATEAEAPAGSDAEQRMRLRSIDVQLLRILEEISVGRQESVTDLRAEIASLTAAVRQLARIRGGAAGE